MALARGRLRRPHPARDPAAVSDVRGPSDAFDALRLARAPGRPTRSPSTRRARRSAPTSTPRPEALAVPERLDEIAAAVPGTDRRGLAAHLFGTLGLHGDVETYDDPANSFLHRVLERRRGMPDLAVDHHRRGRAADRPRPRRRRACPGHFLVRRPRRRRALPRPVRRRPHARRGPSAASGSTSSSARARRSPTTYLEPTPTVDVLARVLANLRAAYTRRGDQAAAGRGAAAAGPAPGAAAGGGRRAGHARSRRSARSTRPPPPTSGPRPTPRGPTGPASRPGPSACGPSSTERRTSPTLRDMTIAAEAETERDEDRVAESGRAAARRAPAQLAPTSGSSSARSSTPGWPGSTSPRATAASASTPGSRRSSRSASAKAGAPHPYPRNPIGYGMGAPTVFTHGSDDAAGRATCARCSPARRCGASCSASRAPAPTSPASSTRAVRDGDEWVVNGQKVWTTLAHLARFGMLVARTDPSSPSTRA